MKHILDPFFWLYTIGTSLVIGLLVIGACILFDYIGHNIWFGIPILIIGGLAAHGLMEKW